MSGPDQRADPAEVVRLRRHGDHVAVIEIDRPQRRNAFDRATAHAVERAIDAFEADDELRVAILTGAGGTFSAGQDLTAVHDEGVAAGARRGPFGVLAVPPEKPLIAAVEGHALGGGFELGLACDMIVAARDAVFGLPEVQLSAMAVGGGLLNLPRWVPRAVAMELCLAGERWSAERLHGLGLVNRVAAPGGALAAALELADAIALGGPLAVRASKAVLRRAPEWPEVEGWDRQRELADPVLASADFAEGVAAFRERRTPVWRGC